MAIFSLSMSASPGPVNMAIVSAGAHHGVRNTMPFVSGAVIGFTLLLVAVGVSLHALSDVFSAAMPFLSLLGGVFIVRTGWSIMTADASLGAVRNPVPTFFQGWLLQWTNPKAWIACASGAALFSDPHSAVPFMLFVVIYFAVCFLSLAAWAVLGQRVSYVLTSERRVKLFNSVMGILLVGCAFYLVVPQLDALYKLSSSSWW
ncbi:LysE family translocator [Massilia sp. CF038]|uniref:LysE family translocator n=1 Tax=Massilia sp. CF038 TaxID=1881045 RepID=UPI0009352FB0|nr:LysE family translocator [Massilia sp. CF038]